MVLRLGEQYLIRAEARAQSNKIPEAQADLNAIVTGQGFANATAATKGDLLTADLARTAGGAVYRVGQPLV